MFRGCITEVGVVVECGDGRVVVRAPKACGGLDVGSSVAVAGVCLTVDALDGDVFRAAVSPETARRSTVSESQAGSLVNVETPLRVGDGLDGHLVQGHVDAIGKVVRIADEDRARRVWIRPPRRFLEELAPKGSVAVDGVSLTVAEIVRDRFSVSLIPATLHATTLASLVDGSRVNLENDLVGKLARRHEGSTHRALAAIVGSLPWAGHVTGRVGVEKAVGQVAAGGAVVVWDPAREGEGDVIAAGWELRPETFVFFLTRACGHTTIPCDRERLERLEIPLLPGSGDRQGTSAHLSVDLAASPGTGVSAFDRSATVRRLAHPDARPEDFLRPGHVFPLSARDGGFAVRTGHTEAAVELCRAAGLPTVAAICEVMSRDGTMAGFAELERFALRWGLPLIDINDLIAWL